MTESPVDKPVRIFLAISGATFLFALMNLFVKLAAEDGVPIPQVMFFRNFIGMIPVLWLITQRRDWSLFKTQRLSGHFVRGFVGFFSMCCIFWSLHLLPLANATAIHFASPLILTSLSVVLLDEKVGPHRWTAVLVGLAAVLFMLQPAGDGDPLGSLVAMCAAILMAFAMIAIRKLSNSEHSLTIVFYFTVFSSLMSAAWMFFVWVTPSWPTLLCLIATGLIGGVGQILVTYAYSKGPAAYVSSFSYFAIVIAAAFDFLIWEHIPVWQVWVGSPVVIASGLYIVWRETKKKYTPTATGAIDLDGSGTEIPTGKDREDQG